MKATIAAFKHIEYSFIAFYQFDENRLSGYYQVTEWTEVDLPDLPRETQANNLAEEVDGIRSELTESHKRRLASFDELTKLPE